MTAGAVHVPLVGGGQLVLLARDLGCSEIVIDLVVMRLRIFDEGSGTEELAMFNSSHLLAFKSVRHFVSSASLPSSSSSLASSSMLDCFVMMLGLVVSRLLISVERLAVRGAIPLVSVLVVDVGSNRMQLRGML